MKIPAIIEVLQIVSKYLRENDQYVQAEHDVIFLPIGNDKSISEDDAKRLLELGAFKSQESDTWAVFS